MIAPPPFEAELLTPEKFDFYWPHITDELDRVPQYWDTWWTKDAIYDATKAGIFQVWGVGPSDEVRLVAFTQVVNYPANRILQAIIVLGNSLVEAAPVFEAALEQFARAKGVTKLEVVGRPGLERFLGPYGLRKTGVVLARDVYQQRTQ